MRAHADASALHRGSRFLTFPLALVMSVGSSTLARVGSAQADASSPLPPPVPVVSPSPPPPPPPPPPSVAPSAPPSEITWTPHLLVQSDALVARHGPDAPAISDGTTHLGLYLRRARVGTDAAGGIWRARVIVEATSEPETADTFTGANTNTNTNTLTAGRLDPLGGEIGGHDTGVTAARGSRPTEAFVALAPHKAFAIAAGALRVPVGLSRQVDEADLRLPERARIITRATPDFRVGVAASGDLGLLQYALGTYSAAPTFGLDFSTGGMLYVLRLSGEPVGPLGVAPQLRRHNDPWADWWRFSAGLTLVYGQLPGANEFGLGGDGQVQWSRLCVTGELLWTRRETRDRIGFTVEPGVFLWPDRVELVARVEWLNDEVGPRSAVDAWGTSVGATFFSAVRHSRLQVAYTLRRPGAGDDRVAGWAVVRATFTL